MLPAARDAGRLLVRVAAGGALALVDALPGGLGARGQLRAGRRRESGGVGDWTSRWSVDGWEHILLNQV